MDSRTTDGKLQGRQPTASTLRACVSPLFKSAGLLHVDGMPREPAHLDRIVLVREDETLLPALTTMETLSFWAVG